MVNFDFLRQHIDFTNVNPFASKEEIDKFCKNAIKYKVKTVYVQPSLLEYVYKKLKNKIDIGTTGGFPFGNIPLSIKLKEIEYAAYNGARWIDICLNLSNVKSKDWNNVRNEIYELKNKSIRKDIGLKLIIETPFLTNREIKKIVQISEKSGIEFIKTASGVRNKVLRDHVRLIKPMLKSSKIKAAGGISTLREANEFFRYGASIIGSSKGFDILREALND